MVPSARILETAREWDADLIGLSGLITPSLEEMSFVASEMERQGFKIPLLIGGATTSRTHTAVKIEPRYHAPGHPRPRRVAGGRRRVRAPRPRPARRVRDDASATSTPQVRHDRGERQEKEARHPIEEARRHRFAIDWTGPGAVRPPRPTFLGVRTIEAHPLDDLVDRIDWTPFFATWELRGAFPAILDDPVVGAAARDLHRDAVAMLRRIVDERVAHGERGVRLLAGEQHRRRHRALRGRCALRRRGRRPHPSAADGEAARPAEPRPRRLHRAEGDRRRGLRRGVRRHRGARPGASSSPRSRRTTTTTRRSSPRPSPTAWRRPSPSGSTSSSGASSGATRRTSGSRTTRSSARSTRASARRPATRPARTTPRRARCSSSSTRSGERGSA